MKSSRFAGEALAFSDIFFKPVHDSKVLPSQVDLSTQITRNIRASIPFITAAMDTVTESEMAIAIAREGGVGTIHKNLSIEAQAEEVRIVKRSQSGMISNPITVTPETTLDEVEILSRRYRHSGFPVVIDENILVGLVTNRDIRLQTGAKLVSEVMRPIEQLQTRPAGTSLEEALEFFRTTKLEKLPLVKTKGISEKELVGLYTWKDVEHRTLYPSACLDSVGRLVVAAAIGTDSANFLPRAEALVEAEVDILVIDTKNGHYQFALEALSILRKKFPNVEIIPANIVVEDGIEELADRGASAIKIGMGVGTICSSSDVTGVGSPQAEAIMVCAEKAHKVGLPLIADGGFTNSADVTKALVLGANAIMSGFLFAGTNETPTEPLAEDPTLAPYRGMGSRAAMAARFGGSRYVQNRVPEGIEGAVPRKGFVASVVADLITGVRTGFSELNLPSIEKAWEAALPYYKYTGAGQRESHPHDVIPVEEVRRRRPL